jgi:hypothetical protein
METMMRTLKTEELELVAGAISVTPAFENSASTKNNGLGDGDQGCPSEASCTTNQAENTTGGGTHTSGFPMVPD